MMKDIRQEINTQQIKQDIASGAYYQNARRWYDDIYHKPIAERSYYIVIMVLSALTIFFSSLVYTSMSPLKRVVPYTIYTQDMSNEFSVLTSLKEEPGEDINLSIVRFLIKNYISVREDYSYDVTKLEWQYNRVQAVSDAEEFARYRVFVNPENLSSPLNRYGRTHLREANIYNLSIDLDDDVKMATAYFTTYLRSEEGLEQNNWVAKITFSFPELTVDPESNEVLQWNAETEIFEPTSVIKFVVNKYVIQEVTQQQL